MTRERLIFVKNLDMFIQNKKDKTAKFIMLIIEKHLKKVMGEHYRNTKEFAEIRNTVFDSINDFYADICLAIESNDRNEE